MIDMNCDYCGKKIQKYPYEIKEYLHHFCNNKCKGKWQSLARINENAAHWNNKIPTKEKLKKLYETKTSREIAKKHNVSKNTILNRLEKYNIEKKQPNYNNIIIKQTFELGWVCGAIFGDGCLHHTKNNGYEIHFSSKDKPMIETYKKYMEMFVPDAKIRISHYNIYNAIFCCKELYNLLLPFKKYCRWEIPSFLTKKESIFGFISGIFDADGGISKKGNYRGQLHLTSKYEVGLKQVKVIFDQLKIKSNILHFSNPGRPTIYYRLYATEKKSVEIFKDEIGFQLPRKQLLLNSIVSNYLVSK